MHLPKLPTIFVKGGEERKAYFTVQARELVAAGWVEKGEEKPIPKKVEAVKAPEVKAAPRVESKIEPKTESKVRLAPKAPEGSKAE
jgi:hypothetical protein